MLSTMRSSWLLYAVLALVALGHAITIEDVIHVDGIGAYLHHGEKRQASGTGSSTPDPEPTPTESSTQPSNTPSAPPTSSRTTAPPSNSPSPPPPPPPSSTPESTPAEETPSNTQATTTPDRPTSAPPTSATRTPTPTTTTRPLLGTSTRQFTTVITTVSNSQTLELTSTGQSTETLTTGSEVVTSSALPQEGNSSGSGGLSDSSKKIIGGVVGGVGGAFLLGGIALVCWRLWGKKNRVAEDDADLMANTGAALGDKPQNNASPFQSNLEQYHNPGGRPNAAANF